MARSAWRYQFYQTFVEDCKNIFMFPCRSCDPPLMNLEFCCRKRWDTTSQSWCFPTHTKCRSACSDSLSREKNTRNKCIPPYNLSSDRNNTFFITNKGNALRGISFTHLSSARSNKYCVLPRVRGSLSAKVFFGLGTDIKDVINYRGQLGSKVWVQQYIRC